MKMKLILEMTEAVALGMQHLPASIKGQLSKEDFNNMCHGLCKIAMIIPTTIGGKTLGHMGLVIPADK